jgi:hypothetical protein
LFLIHLTLEDAMKKLVAAALLGTALLSAAPASAQLLGATSYQSVADSPFNGQPFTYFYLEDLEDGAINTPGLDVTGGGLCITVKGGCFTSVIDSVGNGGNELVGHSIWAVGPITVTFDAVALGSLPTAAGLVWTDGNNPVTFEAFDQNGISLGTIVASPATAGFNGQTDEDSFFGIINPGGISRLTINNPPATEIDHIQYGLLSQVVGVPEPGTWMSMLLGFAAIGFALRRRRRKLLLT